MTHINEIRAIATQVREAMDDLVANNEIRLSYPFCQFPKACCGDMSIILATHLQILGFELPDYICGFLEDRRSHAWLRLDGICIDITADQFDFAFYPKVIVEYEENYPLNKIFKSDKPPSKYTIDKPHLSDLYRKLKEKL